MLRVAPPSRRATGPAPNNINMLLVHKNNYNNNIFCGSFPRLRRGRLLQHHVTKIIIIIFVSQLHIRGAGGSGASPAYGGGRPPPTPPSTTFVELGGVGSSTHSMNGYGGDQAVGGGM